MASPAEVQRILDIMARLRDPKSGCPWDVAQTFKTIAPYTIEEAYEVAEAIETADMAALKEELGDLLLQVVFHARMAEEADAFGFEDIAEAIADKMVRRHPHVFGEASTGSTEAQTAAWEEQKAGERQAKGAASALDGVGLGLPALSRAAKLQRRAARVGFDWETIAPIFDKLDEEIAELRQALNEGSARIEEEIGDLLFTVTNLARHLATDPEQALRGACRKFERRFRAVEARMTAAGKKLGAASLDEMEAAWQQTKADTKLR